MWQSPLSARILLSFSLHDWTSATHDDDDKITQKEFSAAFGQKGDGQEGSRDVACFPEKIATEDVDVFNLKMTVIEQLGVCEMTTLKTTSMEVSEVDVSCDDEGNATLTVDLKAGLDQEKMKWSKLELWTFACTEEGEKCPCKNFQASDMQEWQMLTRDESCTAMVAARKGCSDDCEMKGGFMVLANRVCPAPIANIAKQIGGAADCGTGSQLVEQLEQKKFGPVLWVSVKRRQSKLEALADILGPIGLMFGLLSIGGVQRVASLILLLNLIIQFHVQLGLPDKFRNFANPFTDVMTVAKIRKFDFDSLKIVKKIVAPVFNAFTFFLRMLSLKRCWFPQWEHLRAGGVLIASRGARPELRLIICKAAQREMKAKWHADIMMHFPCRRSGARFGDGLTPVVWSLAASRAFW